MDESIRNKVKRMFTRSMWIGAAEEKEVMTPFEEGGYASVPCPHLRRAFAVSGRVKKATLRATAKGIYIAEINGCRVTDGYWNPGWTDYRHWFQVQEYDVTGLLREGANAVGCTLADGWYAGYVGLYGKGLYGEFRRLFLAELHIEYADGKEETVPTDSSWTYRFGGILTADLLQGQTVDAALDAGDFSSPDYAAEGWAPCAAYEKGAEKLRLQESERMRETFVLRPSLKRRAGTKRIYDFAQNMAGVASVRMRAEKGSVVRLRFAEKLTPEGELYIENLRKAKATDYYAARGGESETFFPEFTYHGFRYMEFEVLKGKAEPLEVYGHVIHNDLRETGAFSCSCEIVNKFYSNVLWGQRGNFVSIPTDCPQRDERLGWAGDAQIFSAAAMYNADCLKFYKKYLADLRLTVNPENGAVYNVAPYVPIADEGNNAWGDAITVLPYRLYLMYGDKGALEDNYDAMKGWVDYLVRESEDYVRKPGYRNPGDWLNLDDNTDIRAFNTLYSAHSADLTSRAARALGKTADAEKYRGIYENFKRAFRRAFVRTDGRIESDTQSAYILAYAFGVMGEEVRPHLLRVLEARDYHLTTGFAGVRYALDVLCDLGRADVAYRIATCTSYPSWGYSIMSGATTVWERWDSLTRFYGAEVLADASMNSFNHYSLGSSAAWLYAYVLGIRPEEDAAGFRRVRIAPAFDRSGYVTRARGSYDSVRGRIEAAWERVGGVIRYTVEKPADMPADFEIDKVIRIVQDGEEVKTFDPAARHTTVIAEV